MKKWLTENKITRASKILNESVIDTSQITPQSYLAIKYGSRGELDLDDNPIVGSLPNVEQMAILAAKEAYEENDEESLEFISFAYSPDKKVASISFDEEDGKIYISCQLPEARKIIEMVNSAGFLTDEAKDIVLIDVEARLDDYQTMDNFNRNELGTY